MHALSLEYAQSALCLPADVHWLALAGYVHTLGEGLFKARGIKKDSVPDMVDIEHTNILVKSGIVYPDSTSKLDKCRSRLLSLVITTSSRGKCREFIDKVREARFIKIKK